MIEACELNKSIMYKDNPFLSLTKKPIAVLISDIHYSLKNLELADNVMNQALSYGEKHNLPVVIAGDLHDTKAVMRSECVQKMIMTFKNRKVIIHLIPGNHDLDNEKSETNALEFLRPYANLYTRPFYINSLNLTLIPYQSDLEKFLKYISEASRHSPTIIVHQGIIGANQGDYVFDKSAVHKQDLSDFRIISGHYHRHQDIKCGRPRKGAVGLASYIGSPYTQSFGEAYDPPKGFQVLHDNGLLEFIPTNLRKHVILERDALTPYIKSPITVNPEDLLWLKITGTHKELSIIDKEKLGKYYLGHSNFKLEKIYLDSKGKELRQEKLTGEETFDKLIDETAEDEEQKKYLKSLWREIL